MRTLIARVGLVGGWLLVIVLLALWVAEAVHRGHAAGVWITSVGLAGVVIIPLLASRLRS